MSQRKITVSRQKWPINGTFRISRGTKRSAEVVYVEIKDGDIVGRGEAVPYARYGETPRSVIKQIKQMSKHIEGGMTRLQLIAFMAPGAARNAIDAALWDIEAKMINQPASALANVGILKPVLTAYTISLDTPENMAKAALEAQYHPLLKLKLGGGLASDRSAMITVRHALPQHRLIVDANEAWTADSLFPLLDTAYECNIELVEQPLPVNSDQLLSSFTPPVPICADESFHTIDDIEIIKERYQAVNIKIDKTGGLTHALAVQIAARDADLKIMIGCMVASSLAMAPAYVLTGDADWVDLDGPLLLSTDREHGLQTHNGVIYPPERELWG